MQKKIKPMRDKCDCGKKVTDHHWLCNKCWRKKYAEKQREEDKIKRMKTGNEVIINPMKGGQEK